MQTTRGSVCVDPTFGLVFTHDALYLSNKFPQPFNRHSAVLNERRGSGRLLPRVQDSQAHLADVPHPRLLLGRLGDRHNICQATHRLFQRRWLVPAKFNDQHCGRIARHPTHLTRIRRDASCQLNNKARDQFDRARFQFQQARHSIAGFYNAVVSKNAEDGMFRFRNEVDLSAANDSQSPFTAGKESRHIDRGLLAVYRRSQTIIISVPLRRHGRSPRQQIVESVAR